MKIAVASRGKTENSEVSEIGARADYFLVFEGKKLIKTIKNPFLGGGGAGFSVASMLENEKVQVFASQKIGPNMKTALEDRKIKGVEFGPMKVSEALNKI